MLTESLRDAALAAQKLAYAPYSEYYVGAAILDGSGQIWAGCNVENISYGLCICAERTAVCKMISEGSREVLSVAVATRDGGTPCGMCLQTLLEFCSDPNRVEVFTISGDGRVTRYILGELIPFGFSSKDLKRT
jgi:cytidine deaminase